MITLYHIVKSLIIITKVKTEEISIPWKINNPVILPSVIPIPPGMNDAAPKINDEAYVDITV